jgi:phage baseplate assembly protein W
MITYKGLSTYNRFKKFKLTDFELAKQDLFNHFNIRKGEKLMNPNFGTIIWDVLFEPFTPEIRQAIIDDIKAVASADPRILVSNVIINEFSQGIRLELELIYVPTNQVDVMLMKFEQNARTAILA